MTKRIIKVTVKHLQEYHPELNAFLVKRRLRSKFLKNCDTFILIDVKRLSISGAFAWACTPEGKTFWRKIDAKFSKSFRK